MFVRLILRLADATKGVDDEIKATDHSIRRSEQDPDALSFVAVANGFQSPIGVVAAVAGLASAMMHCFDYGGFFEDFRSSRAS